VEIKKKITSRTKAILPVHFAGMPCEMSEIHKVARKNGLKIIEDACHALGAEYKYNGKWVKVGSCRHSDMTVFSFHPVKHITTGEGGAITTNSKKLYEKLCALRAHGIYRSEKMRQKNGPWYYEMRDLGFNYRITDFQCALGISQLKKLDGFIKRRRLLFKTYERLFKNNQFFELPLEKDDVKPAWHLYSVKLKGPYIKKRKELVNTLREKGIGIQVHYIPVHMQPYYKKHFKYKIGDFPMAEDYYKMTVTLPLYPGMRDRDIQHVVQSIRDFK